MMKSTQIRVRFYETDQQGVVHHSQYLSYFEVARVEFFRSLGYEIKQFEAQQIDLAVVAANVEYKGPAHFDDLLDLYVQVDHIGTASFGIAYQIQKAGKLITTGSTRLACLKANGRPTRIPKNFREALAAHLVEAPKETLS